jgi:hypothetical protein
MKKNESKIKLKQMLERQDWLVMETLNEIESGYYQKNNEFVDEARRFFGNFDLCAIKHNQPVRWYVCITNVRDPQIQIRKLRRFEDKYGSYACQFIVANYKPKRGFIFNYADGTRRSYDLNAKVRIIEPIGV